MNTNKVLSYLFYTLFAVLILVFAYKVYQMRSRQAKVDQENAEFQQTLRDFGYIEADTAGSDFSDNGKTYTDPAPTIVNSDGIEEEYSAPKKSSKPATQSKTTTQSKSTSTPVKTTTPTVTPSATQSGTTRITDLDTADGRYRVVAGSFTVLDGARREMERLIKMGYHDAEVGKYNRGKYAVVIVKRTNSLTEATKLKNKLISQGIDATVIDKERK